MANTKKERPGEGCKVFEAQQLISNYLSESNHFCPACMRGFREIRSLLHKIQAGKGEIMDVINLEPMAEEILHTCQCTNGKEIASIFLTSQRRFRSDFLLHVENRYCPAGDCERLIAAPCQLACPAGVDAPSYVALVGMGRYKEALQVLREDLSLPGSLGRICVHPCERACRRGKVDAPIAICRLKRVAFDKAYEEGVELPKQSPPVFKERIAIIGSGPAGLSTGYFLTRMGYGTTIFESMPEPGGMLRWGIPAFRLPREILDADIGYISALGVQIETNVTLGKDFSLKGLKEQGYQAIFLGVGARKGMSLAIEGEKAFSGIQDALHFLHQASLGRAEVGKRVIVVGGGNAAVDCVRTALRLDSQEVHLLYRRSRYEMPANIGEVEAAEEEGAVLDFLLSPVRVHGKNGQLTGLECIRNRMSEPDSTGGRRPMHIEGTERIIHADTIICAIGQEVDVAPFGPEKELELTRRRLLRVDPDSLETSVPGVFAGGDVVSGPATVVEAVAAGKKAAESIHCYLQGIPCSEHALFPAKRKWIPLIDISAREKSFYARPNVPRLPIKQRREHFSEVELCLPGHEASREAKRCLRCDICISCGRCVEVCRDVMGVEAIHLSYVDEHGTEETNFLRPAERCIGCGSCVIICPTGAITMEEKDEEKKIKMCGAEMSRHKLMRCAACGTPFITQKHLHFIHEKAHAHNSIKYPRMLCPECARALGAGNLARIFAR